jgi:hypothetical protein
VVGLQATDLLIAVHLAFGPIEKEAEVALIPEERPVRTSLISFFDSGFKRIGAPIFTVDSVDSTDAICSLTSVLWNGCPSSDGRGTAGSRDGFTVISTAGVACTPKLCAAFRLKTFEARPDARYGPVRGKTATRIRPFGSEPLSADHGSLVQVGTFPSGFVLGGQTTDTLYCRDVHNVER